MENRVFARLNINGIGKIFVSASEHGICRISFSRDHTSPSPSPLPWPPQGRPRGESVSARGGSAFGGRERMILKALKDELLEYASGARRKFGVKVDIRTGTPFQRSVWRSIAKIPWGETRSYKWLAKSIGRPTAVRAVANACGVNPVPIIIPCHRVIASDGGIGGFSCGIELKKKILAIEGITTRSPSRASDS